MDRVIEGSRREDTQSPFTIWSNDALDGYTLDGEDLDRARQLGRLMVVRAHISRLNGEGGAAIDDETAVLRFAQDLHQGAVLWGTLAASGPWRSGWNAVAGLLERGPLTADEADRLHREIAHSRRDVVTIGDILEDEFVESAWMLDHDDLPRPPRACGLVSPDLPLLDRIWAARHLGTYMRTYREIWQVQELPFPQRLAIYERMEADWPAPPSMPGVQQSAFYAHTLFAIRLAMRESQRALLQVGAAWTVVRLRSGVPPDDLEMLLDYDAAVPIVDPMTHEPFELLIDGDVAILRSVAAAPTRRPEFGVDRILNIDPIEKLSLRLPLGLEPDAIEPDEESP